MTSTAEQTAQTKPAAPARKRAPSRASRAAAATQKPAAKAPAKAAPKTAPKPAAKKPAEPKGMTATEKRRIALAALIDAGAELVKTWKHPDVTREEAAEYIAHRLSYCGTDHWNPALPARTMLASRTPKSK